MSQPAVFASIDDVQTRLARGGYVADRGLATSIYLAVTLRRPLFLEGEAGVGKTSVAAALAAVLGVDLIRLQCYEGLDLAHAVYEWDYARQQRWGADGVKARHGVEAHQLADYLGLSGDAVDNIPGVPGIGAKTAAALLEHFGSLDAILARVDEIPYLRLRGAAQHAARLREHREPASGARGGS